MAIHRKFGNGGLRSAFVNRYFIFVIGKRIVQKLLWCRAIEKKQ